MRMIDVIVAIEYEPGVRTERRFAVRDDLVCAPPSERKNAAQELVLSYVQKQFVGVYLEATHSGFNLPFDDQVTLFEDPEQLS